MTGTQVHVEQSTVTTVEVTSEQQTTIEVTKEVIQTMEHEQKQTESDEPAIIHLSKDDIEEYEESQAKFRELWEKKREKVRYF